MRCMKYCHRLLASVLGIVLLMLGSGHAVQAQTKAYAYNQIAVTLDVQSDGLIDAPMPGWQQSDEATSLTSSQQQASGGATGPGIGFFIVMIALFIMAIPLILFLIFRYEPPHRQESDSEESSTIYPARRTSSSQGRSSYYGGSSFSDSGGSSFSDSGSSFGGGGDGGSGGGDGGAG